MLRLRNLFSNIALKNRTGFKVGAWQAVLHLAAIYAVARFLTPWLLGVTNDTIIPMLTGRSPRIDLQFFYSHLFEFSFIPGLLAGFFNAQLLRHGVVRFVWLAPIVVLAFAFLFYAPGVYPTMIWESNFREACHYYFSRQFSIPEYSSYAELQRNLVENMREVLRGYDQLRISVPAYVGVAYSIGASFSLHSNKKVEGSSNVLPSAELTN